MNTVAIKETINCNFCLSKFQKISPLDNTLHICKDCFDKTSQQCFFTLSSPDNQLFNLYLLKKNIEPSLKHPQIDIHTQNFLKNLHYLQQTQLKSFLQMFNHITQSISTLGYIENTRIATITSIFTQAKNNHQSIISETLIEFQKQIAQIQAFKAKLLEEIQQQQNQQSINKSTEESVHQLDMQLKRCKRKVNCENSLRLPTRRDNIKIKKVEGEGFGPDFYDYNISNWNKTSGAFIGIGRQTSKSQNIIEAEKEEFITKICSLKTKIHNFLENQSKISPVLLKITADNICQAVITTKIEDKCIELVSYKIPNNFDVKCYLSMLQWQQIQVFKLVKVQLTDEDCKLAIDFIKNKKIESLVLTNNKLTEEICKYLAGCEFESLKNIYLGKNQIITIKARKQIKELKEKYNLYL